MVDSSMLSSLSPSSSSSSSEDEDEEAEEEELSEDEERLSSSLSALRASSEKDGIIVVKFASRLNQQISSNQITAVTHHQTPSHFLLPHPPANTQVCYVTKTL